MRISKKTGLIIQNAFFVGEPGGERVVAPGAERARQKKHFVPGRACNKPLGRKNAVARAPHTRAARRLSETRGDQAPTTARTVRGGRVREHRASGRRRRPDGEVDERRASRQARATCARSASASESRGGRAGSSSKSVFS